MSEPNFWADFVRWVAERASGSWGTDVANGLRATAGLVSTRGEARAALYAAMSYPVHLIDQSASDFAHETGRTPPADTRSVDVPPTGGRETLLKLAERFEKYADGAIDREDPSQWDRGVRRGLLDAAEMARAAAEDL